MINGRQNIFIFDSPDGTGKTEIAKELSIRSGIPYFKMTTEHENWRRGKFLDALRFDQTYIHEFLNQTGYSAIIDRAYPAEWVYSQVFKRKTDFLLLGSLDVKFADLGTTIIVPLRNDYSSNREDEVVPKSKLRELHDMYLRFCSWTRCKVIKIYVDDFSNNIEEEMLGIYEAIAKIGNGQRSVVVEGGWNK